MRRAVGCLLLLLLASCAKPPQPLWIELPTVEQLLERMQQLDDRFRSLDAEVSVNLATHGKTFSSQQFLLLERPDRFRTDVLTGFGQLLLQLTSDGEQLAVFLPAETPRHFFRGPASDENIARFTRIPLPVNSLIRLLLYDPPLIDRQLARVEQRDKQVQLILENSERRQELVFDAQLQLVSCRYLAGDELLLEIDYEDIAADGFPRRLTLNLTKEQTRAALRFSAVKTNVAIAPDKFALQQPDKLEIEPLP